MAYISPSMREQLNTPHQISYSLIRIFLWSLFFLGLGILCLCFTYHEYRTHEEDYWKGFILSAIFIVGFCMTVLSSLLKLGSPAVIISREGLQFAGKALIPWSFITENKWQEVRRGVMPLKRMIVLRVNGQRVAHNAMCFKCTGKNYLHYCNVYSSADTAA